jgi:xanthine/uracil permease
MGVGDAQEVEITIGKLLRIYWLLLWRAAVGAAIIGGMFGFVIGLVMGLARFPREQIALVTGPVGLVVGVIWSVFVLRMMLEKQYKDFRIAVIAR